MYLYSNAKEHKAKLDEEEVSWMRGGYENAVNVINTLKEQSQTLVDNLKELEQQKDDLKSSYEQSVEEVKYWTNYIRQVFGSRKRKKPNRP